jgi:hypothetical protein
MFLLMYFSLSHDPSPLCDMCGNVVLLEKKKPTATLIAFPGGPSFFLISNVHHLGRLSPTGMFSNV